MTIGEQSIWQRIPPPVGALLAGLIYYALSQASLLTLIQPVAVAPFWFSNGFSLAILLLTPRSRWAWLLGGIFCSSFLLEMQFGYIPVSSVIMAASNVVEPLGCALLMQTLAGGAIVLSNLRGVLVLLLSPWLVCMLSAAMGAYGVLLSKPDSSFNLGWKLWYLDDVLGIYVITPGLLALSERALRSPWGGRHFEKLALAACLTAVCLYVFARYDAELFDAFTVYWTLPFVLWGTLRFGVLGATMATFFVTACALLFTVKGLGPFAMSGADRADGALALQFFSAIHTGSVLVLAAVLAQRDRAQRQLDAGATRLRNMLEYAPDAIVVLDVETGRFVEANTNAEKMFGLSKEELLARGPVELSPQQQRDGTPSADAGKNYIQNALEGKPQTFEWLHIDGRGETIECEVRLSPFPMEGRRLVRGSLVDITERRRTESALQQVQKNESIGRLAGGVAHDFNNLLTVVIGNAELAQRHAGENARLTRQLDNILESARRGARLTQQLLGYARRQVMQPEILEINEILRNSADLWRRLIGEDIELALRPADEKLLVKADRGQIDQVLMNLIANARDAMPKGGRILVEAVPIVLGEEYVRVRPDVTPGEYVLIAVTDNGEGISPDVLARVFEPFFTTKPAGKGTGLGLSMCFGIVKMSGGHLALYSEPARGTTIRVYLPRLQGVEGRKPTTTDLHSPLGRGETVLLVEDEKTIRELVQTVLEGAGYTVICSPDGYAALEIARLRPVAFDLLITDVVMPRMGGKELADALLKEKRVQKVLFTSGYTENAIVHHGVLDPGIHFLPKPFTAAALGRKVREVLDGAEPGVRG
jgi:PAS domain S-box-containing protein